MEAGDFCPTGPDLSEIQCTRCKHAATMEWEGKIQRLPAGGSCKKYLKEEGGKPKGILFKIVNIDKHETWADGHYIKCPFFEEK